MKKNSTQKTTIKLQCPPQQAKQFSVSASRLGISRNDYLLSLIGNPSTPLAKATTIGQELSRSVGR
jgi:hypothetical protein